MTPPPFLAAADPAPVLAHRLVPVVVVDDADRAVPLGAALAAGGLPVVEVTLRTPAALEVVAALAAAGDVLVGAGTVRTADQVDAAVRAGARFVVSPGVSGAVVARCIRHGVPVVPGAVTASEIQAACDLGLSTVKFFPAATSGGPAAIRALAAPFPDVAFVPTGGIGGACAPDYLALPAVAAVGGSWMAPRDLIRAGDLAAVTDLTRRAVDAASAASRPARGARRP